MFISKHKTISVTKIYFVSSHWTQQASTLHTKYILVIQFLELYKNHHVITALLWMLKDRIFFEAFKNKEENEPGV